MHTSKLVSALEARKELGHTLMSSSDVASVTGVDRLLTCFPIEPNHVPRFTRSGSLHHGRSVCCASLLQEKQFLPIRCDRPSIMAGVLSPLCPSFHISARKTILTSTFPLLSTSVVVCGRDCPAWILILVIADLYEGVSTL